MIRVSQPTPSGTAAYVNLWSPLSASRYPRRSNSCRRTRQHNKSPEGRPVITKSVNTGAFFVTNPTIAPFVRSERTLSKCTSPCSCQLTLPFQIDLQARARLFQRSSLVDCKLFASIHSSRSRIIGSTARAHRAGTKAATTPTQSIVRMTPPRMTGSFGVA